MAIGEFGWIILLHLALAAWLGLLASSWKGRSAWRWTAIGLLTSVFGMLLLARLERRMPSATFETDMQLQHMDGTSLLQ